MSVEHLIGTISAPIEATRDQSSGVKDFIIDNIRENYATFNLGHDLVVLALINFSLDRYDKSILYKKGGRYHIAAYEDMEEEIVDVFQTERDDSLPPITVRHLITLGTNPKYLPDNVKSKNGQTVAIEWTSYMLNSTGNQKKSINVIRYFEETNLKQPLGEVWFAQRERSAAMGQRPQQKAA